MKNHPITVSRRGFLAQSATAGALGCVSGTSVAPALLAQSGDDAHRRAAISRLPEEERQGSADARTPHRSRHLRAQPAGAGELHEGPAGHLPAPRQGPQVAGDRQAAAGVRRKGVVRCQARRSRRADPRRHQGRPHHRRSRRAAQDRAPDDPARHHARREGGRGQRAERHRSLGRRRWRRSGS